MVACNRRLRVTAVDAPRRRRTRSRPRDGAVGAASTRANHAAAIILPAPALHRRRCANFHLACAGLPFPKRTIPLHHVSHSANDTARQQYFCFVPEGRC